MTEENEEYKGLDDEKIDNMVKKSVLEARRDLHRKGISTVQLDEETGKLCEESPDGKKTFINPKEARDDRL